MNCIDGFVKSFQDGFLLKAAFRLVLALIIGAVIGSERAKHGRAAGMRTHIIVCIGAALTAITSIYVVTSLGITGDVFRISAQVISGIGFLGAGMIILKDNDMITGLTSAACVWTTSAIGLAVGYGFFSGALIAALLFLITIVFFTKFEKHKTKIITVYAEIDDMYRTNEILSELSAVLKAKYTHKLAPAKSGAAGHIGLYLTVEKCDGFDTEKIASINGIVFADTE